MFTFDESFIPSIDLPIEPYIPITPFESPTSDLPPFDPETDPFTPLFPPNDPPLPYVYAHEAVANCLYDILNVLRSADCELIYPSLAQLKMYADDPDFREIPYVIRYKLLSEFEEMLACLFPTMLESLRPILHTTLL